MKPLRFTLLTLFCTILCILSGHTQDVKRELGLRSTDLDNFSAVYKWQKSENTYRRLTAGGFSLLYRTDPEQINTGIGVTYGTEKRKDLGGRTQFLHGIQWILDFSYSESEVVLNDPIIGIGAGIGYLLGIQYEISDRFNVGLEFLPTLRADVTIIDDGSSASLRANGSLSSVSLFATYKFSSAGKMKK